MIFILLQDAIDFHEEIIQQYGGLSGIRDMGLLISALEIPKASMFGEYLHPTVFDKAAAYLFHIVCNHPFLDGNKRTGTAISLTFLRLNRVHIKFKKKQSSTLEELVVNMADGKVTKDEIAKFYKLCYKGPKVSEGKPGQIYNLETGKWE